MPAEFPTNLVCDHVLESCPSLSTAPPNAPSPRALLCENVEPRSADVVYGDIDRAPPEPPPDWLPARLWENVFAAIRTEIGEAWKPRRPTAPPSPLAPLWFFENVFLRSVTLAVEVEDV